MPYKFLVILCTSLMVCSCSQEPASIVLYPTTAPARTGHISKNPYKAIVQKGDTLYSIAKKNNVEIRDVIDANRLRPPYILIPGQTVRLPNAAFHIVSGSDTLYAISRSYGVDIGRLARKNNITQPYSVTKGQKLFLPASTEIDSGTEDKTVEYSFDTHAQTGQSNKVVSQELAPIASNKPATNSSLKQIVEDEDSPFAMARDDIKTPTYKPKNTKQTNNTKNYDSVEAKEFSYKSEKELGASGKRNTVKTPPVNKYPIAKPAKNPVVSASLPDDADKPFKEEPKQEKKHATGTPVFAWPISGKIISKFGPKRGGLYNDGINIAAAEGAPIKAAESGDVVYAGNELRGYGNMLLIKHSNGYLTAYAHANDIVAKKGDTVKKGQLIAHIGQTGHVSSPQLHFSIRQGRKAKDPEKYLP